MVESQAQAAKRMADLHAEKQRKGIGVNPDKPFVPGVAGSGQYGPPAEPTFTFRAQDILSVMVLDNYARLLEMYEPNGAKIVRVTDELNKFRAWQQANPGKVKLPD